MKWLVFLAQISSVLNIYYYFFIYRQSSFMSLAGFGYVSLAGQTSKQRTVGTFLLLLNFNFDKSVEALTVLDPF